MDALSDILRLLNLHASVYFHSSFCGSWSLQSDDTRRATFHLIARGNCWLRIPDAGRTVALRGGDLIVFPRNISHAIGFGEDVVEGESSVPEQSGFAGSDETTSLICGYFDFDSPQNNPILDTLPEFIHIKNEDIVKTATLDSILRFVTVETEHPRPGSDVIVDKLSEILFIHVIRAYMVQEEVATGLLAAIADTRLGRAIRAVHEDASKHWSVASLAEKAGMSRSAFAGHFQTVAGMTPMQYVTAWRMQTAFERLRTGRESVAQIAAASGYRTEASFRKAFKKLMGVGPGAVRRGAA